MPIALTYDSLPPRSALRHEINADGSVTITAPAGQISVLARRRALLESAWLGLITAVLICLPLALLAGSAMSTLQANFTQAWWLLPVLLFFSGVFIAALFALVWRTRYSRSLDELEQAALQVTAINVLPGRLMIETNGPIDRHSISISGRVPWRLTWVWRTTLLCLEIERDDRDRCRLFPGLSRGELVWIAREVERIMAA